MRFTGVPYLLIGAVYALGCSSAAGTASPGGYNGGASNGGASGGGGSGPAKVDAGLGSMDGAAPRGDGSVESVKSNLTADAVTFNWDTHLCAGCTSGDGGAGGAGGGLTGTSGSGGAPAGSGGKGAGGSTGAAGSSGMGGSLVAPDAGLGGFGGSAAGGAVSSSGGRSGMGGATSGGSGGAAGARFDGGMTSDAAGDVRSTGDLPVLPTSDASPDTVVADSGSVSPDATKSDGVAPGCQAQIVPVVPALDRIDHLVSGENTRVVLRAVAVSGGPVAGTTWSWQATWNGASLPVAQAGIVEPETAAFAIANPGKYTFTARSGSCVAELPGYAVPPDECGPCDKSVVIRATPPATSNVPVQSGGLRLVGSAPYSSYNVVLAPGVAVNVSASIGTGRINSYVRINDTNGGLVVDGLSDANAGFVTLLRALDDNRTALKYDVLVVPLDGEDGATIAATAPQLYPARDPSSLKQPLPLAGGVTITGTTLDVSGQPVADVRVTLTNQDPAPSAERRSDLIFSSVGRSDAQGKYTLHVQKGSAYWASFFPPTDKGLSDVVSDSALSVAGDGTLSFQWAAATSAALSLTVVDAAGAPAPEVSVRITSSAQTTGVGTLSGALVSTQQGKGNVQVEGATDAAGMVTFPRLPADKDYDVLLMPASLGPSAATTAATLRLAASGTSSKISLLAQASIYGKLVARSLPIDLTGVTIVAYDRSADAPEAPRATSVGADGSFVLGVTPKRSYVLLAVPDIGTGYARTFVGPGPVRSSEFVITQNLLASEPWRATVMDEGLNLLPDTTLQIYCDKSWPNCVDPTVLLAETTSGVGGAFQLDLADPTSRN